MSVLTRVALIVTGALIAGVSLYAVKQSKSTDTATVEPTAPEAVKTPMSTLAAELLRCGVFVKTTDNPIGITHYPDRVFKVKFTTGENDEVVNFKTGTGVAYFYDCDNRLVVVLMGEKPTVWFQRYMDNDNLFMSWYPTGNSTDVTGMCDLVRKHTNEAAVEA